MRDVQLGRFGRAGMGAACAACCALPMLVVVGVVSAGALVAGGVTVASVGAVATLAFAVSTRRIGPTPSILRRALFAGGGAAAFAGLWAVDRSDDATVVLAAAVGLLASAALLALADARSGRTLAS